MGGAKALASGRALLSEHAIVFTPSEARVLSALEAERYPLEVETRIYPWRRPTGRCWT